MFENESSFCQDSCQSGNTLRRRKIEMPKTSTININQEYKELKDRAEDCLKSFLNLVQKMVSLEKTSGVNQQRQTTAATTKVIKPLSDKLVYSASDVAQLLGVSQAMIYRCVRNKEIPCVRVGDRILFSKVAISKIYRARD